MPFIYSPKISVVMSCYNSVKFLEEAITSILNQKYTNFEFIIIDDGSTDDTPNVLLRFAKNDKRIRLIVQKNIGLTKSLNRGINMATGEFLARMDADDISLPDRFSNFIKYLNTSPEVQFYSTPAIVLNNSNGTEFLIPNIFRRKFFHKKMLDFYCSLVHGTLIVKTDIIKSLSYDESFVCAQDFELYLRAIYSGFIISYDPKNISYKLRRHDATITNTRYTTQFDAFKRVLEIRHKKVYKPTLRNRIYFLYMDLFLFFKFKLGLN